MTTKKIIISLVMLFPLTAHALPFAYLAQGINEVDVIDVATNSLLTSIAIPALSPALDSNPTCIAIAPNGKTVCVANANSISASSVNAISISVIDATLAVPALLVPSIPVTSFSNTSFPRDIAYTTDSNSVYITGGDGNVYSVTDITSSQTVATATSAIPFPAPIAIGNTPNGQTAYIGSGEAGHGVYYMPVPANNPTPIPATVDPNIGIRAIAIAPDGLTAYAVALNVNTNAGILYVIDTASNIVTDSLTIATPISFPTGIVISPDGNYLYITDNSKADIIVIPTNNLSNITTFTSADPIALAITPDSKELYVTNTSAEVSPYRVPAGTPVTPSPILTPASASPFSIVISPPNPLSPPSSVSGCKTKNVFLLQTDYINNITWTAPATGTTPAAYAIYRDATLTQLVAIVPASGPLQYYDHDRNPNVTYTYYIVSVDASGNQSTANSVTVTQNC
jgi:DNA-binding beta-propeller fold protein YncE